jgi:hypothetical protein
MHATWSKPPLSNFKPLAFSQQNVVQWHTHVVEPALVSCSTKLCDAARCNCKPDFGVAALAFLCAKGCG